MAYDKDDQLSTHCLTDEDGEEYYGAEEGPSNMFISLASRISLAETYRKGAIEDRKWAQKYVELAAGYGLTTEEYSRRHGLWAEAHLRWMRYGEDVGDPEPLKEDYLRNQTRGER